MKKTVITAVLALLLTVPAAARPGESAYPVAAPFAKQIEFLLNQNDFARAMANIEARVLFTFDAENRIRILDVESSNPGLKALVAEKLDGRKVFVGQYLEGKRFILPIRIAS